MNRRIAFWPALILALAVTLGVHLLMFPGSVPDFVRASGGGTLLDAKPAFSENALYKRLEAFGEEGRRNYRLRNLTVDVLLPLSVLPFLILLSRRAVERLLQRGLLSGLILAAPFVYVTFDLIENAVVLALLARFPDRWPTLSAVLPVATVIKRTASLLALLLPVAVLVYRRWIPAPPPQSMNS